MPMIELRMSQLFAISRNAALSVGKKKKSTTQLVNWYCQTSIGPSWRIIFALPRLMTSVGASKPMIFVGSKVFFLAAIRGVILENFCDFLFWFS